jgi:GT2 family glycosyltransferase
VTYTIVVVTWECADYLAALIASMNRWLDGSQELVVVDNASSDDPATGLGAWRGRQVFVALEENRGFGAANNVGVRTASSDVVVLLNPDCELVDDSLDALAQASFGLQALVGPRVLNSDGTLQPSASGRPVGFWPWLQVFLPGRISPRTIQRHTEPWRLQKRARVAWLTGACLAAPRSLLEELGPFDESIHLYSEDMELGLRAAERGIASFFCPETARIVHHADGSSSRRFSDAGLSLAARNRRAVVRGLYGSRAERLAWWAEWSKLELRVLAKTTLRIDRERDRSALDAWKASRRAERGAPAEG